MPSRKHDMATISYKFLRYIPAMTILVICAAIYSKIILGHYYTQSWAWEMYFAYNRVIGDVTIIIDHIVPFSISTQLVICIILLFLATHIAGRKRYMSSFLVAHGVAFLYLFQLVDFGVTTADGDMRDIIKYQLVIKSNISPVWVFFMGLLLLSCGVCHYDYIKLILGKRQSHMSR